MIREPVLGCGIERGRARLTQEEDECRYSDGWRVKIKGEERTKQSISKAPSISRAKDTRLHLQNDRYSDRQGKRLIKTEMEMGCDCKEWRLVNAIDR